MPGRFPACPVNPAPGFPCWIHGTGGLLAKQSRPLLTETGNRKPQQATKTRNPRPKRAKVATTGTGKPRPRVVFVSLLTTPAGVVLAWEPRVYNASTVSRVPCFAPAPLCVGFCGFGLFATVPRGLPPQPVKVPGTTTRPGCPVQVVTTMCKCSRVFLSVARLPGFCRRALYTMDYQQPAPGQLRPRGCVGTLYRCPRHNGFFLGFPGV